MSVAAAVGSVLQSFHSYDLWFVQRYEQSDGPVFRAIPLGESRRVDRIFELRWDGASAAQAIAIHDHFAEMRTFTTFPFFPPPDQDTAVRVVYIDPPRIAPQGGAYTITVRLQEF